MEISFWVWLKWTWLRWRNGIWKLPPRRISKAYIEIITRASKRMAQLGCSFKDFEEVLIEFSEVYRAV